ncbi:hypothetical protein HOK00_02870 [bacterium]|jgi:hypothetical protein|nr:hypothetical protein [bacterium]
MINIRSSEMSVRSSEINVNDRDTRCSPNISFDSLSCIKLSILIELANAYNKDTRDKLSIIKLNNNLEALNPTKYKKYLLREFQKRLGNKCTTQKCWTEQSFVKRMQEQAKRELKKYTFRPNGPCGKFEWLNTYNIDDVMVQYEKKYNDFKFLGTVPMDFDNLPNLGIKYFDYNNFYKQGKRKLGIVFNLDESWKSGSHWVAMYADFSKAHIHYFDSYGTNACTRVRTLMRRIEKAMKKINPNLEPSTSRNEIRHQYGHSECGVYSMNFIIRLLEGESFDNICESKTTDDKINEYRKIYFSNT